MEKWTNDNCYDSRHRKLVCIEILHEIVKEYKQNLKAYISTSNDELTSKFVIFRQTKCRWFKTYKMDISLLKLKCVLQVFDNIILKSAIKNRIHKFWDAERRDIKYCPGAPQHSESINPDPIHSLLFTTISYLISEYTFHTWLFLFSFSNTQSCFSAEDLWTYLVWVIQVVFF